MTTPVSPSATSADLADLATAEFTLVAACSAWPLRETRLAAIRHAVDGLTDDPDTPSEPGRGAASLDWALVLALVDRHRIAGLVHHALKAAGVIVPQPYRAALDARALADGVQELGQVHRTLSLSRALEGAGIRHGVLKGVTTAVMAFGRYGVRYSMDIDVLVDRKSIDAAADVLRGIGYVRTEPGEDASAAEVKAWMARHKDIVFAKPDDDTVVELHWRLFQNPYLMPKAADGPLTTLALLPGAMVPALPEETAWLYSCAHGGEHGWARLKWLADLGALLSRSSGESHRLYAHAHAARLKRLVGPGIILCAKLYGTSVPVRLERDYARDRRMRWITKIAWQSLVGDERGTELEAIPLGATRKNLGHYLISNDPRHWWREFLFDLHDKGRASDEPAGASRVAGLVARLTRLARKDTAKP